MITFPAKVFLVSEIRKEEILELLHATSVIGVEKDSLELLLIDRLPGIGGRFTNLFSFLELLGLIALKDNQIFL